MKAHRRFLIMILLLLAVLLVSIALNYLFYQQGRQYYLQLNAVRLDPLGLSHFRTGLDQSELTRNELYIHKRIHSSLGYLTPAEFESQWLTQQNVKELCS